MSYRFRHLNQITAGMIKPITLFCLHNHLTNLITPESV